MSGKPTTRQAPALPPTAGPDEAGATGSIRGEARHCGLPRLEQRMLWCRVLGVAPAWTIAHDTDPLPAEALRQFRDLAARREAGEPMAYLLGEREFMGRLFQVSPAVLIPRPETELLVTLGLEALDGVAGAPRALDLGTGSGAVAISLALSRPDVQVLATDASADALAVALGNAARLSAPVEFRQGDWWAAVAPDERFDLIVSNPPYIAADDAHLSSGDVRHEPRLALASGEDGLEALRIIVAGAPGRLREGGALRLEHGWDQAPAVRELCRAAGLEEVASWRDLAGIERVTGGRWSV